MCVGSWNKVLLDELHGIVLTLVWRKHQDDSSNKDREMQM
jgi:hypothetical protein